MPVTKAVELQPFTVPNYVTVKMPPGKREDGFREAPKYALHELDNRTLIRLCDEFKDAVLRKARADRVANQEDE